MKNLKIITKMISILLLVFFVIFGLDSCVTADYFSNKKIFDENNTYGFKLSNKQNDIITLVPESPFVVKIYFNIQKVNTKESYIARSIDGGMLNTIYNKKLKTPFVDILKAKNFTNGKHVVSYYLMPAKDKNPKKALAGIKLDVNVSRSFTEKDVILLNDSTNEILTCIKKNDVETFAKLCIDSKKCGMILETIKGTTKNDEYSKKMLEEVSSDTFQKNAKDNFKDLQVMLNANKVNMSSLSSLPNDDNELQVDYPSYKGIKSMIGFETQKHWVMVECFFLVTKNRAYLINFDPKNQLLKKQ